MNTSSVEYAGHAPKLIRGRVKEPTEAAPIACSATNLCAFGHLHHIIVVDTRSAQVVQTLAGHKSTVTALLWKRSTPSLATSNVELVSGDSSGTLLLWDVGEGLVLRSIRAISTAVTSIMLFGSHCLVSSRDGKMVSVESDLTESSSKTVNSSSKPTLKRSHCVSKGSGLVAALLFAADLIVLELESPMEPPRSATTVIKDSDEELVDFHFSTIHPDLIYVATISSICLYDWKLNLTLQSSIVWRPPDQGFERIFSTPAVTSCERAPATFSLTTDGKLSAWYCEGTTPQATAVDVRGHRLSNRLVHSISQLTTQLDRFVVLFTDSSVCCWQYHTEAEVWELEGFIEAQGLGAKEIVSLTSPLMCHGCDGVNIELHNSLYNRIERKFHITQGTGTVLSCLLPGKDAGVWVVLTKTSQSKTFTQIALFDTSVGEVEYLLRPLPSSADPGSFLSLTSDQSGNYLLLLFETNAFEVWSVRTRSMIHVRMGYNLAFVGWGPPGSSINPAWADTTLLATMLVEGGVQFFAIHDDHLTGLKETYPLRLTNGDASVSLVCTIADTLVCFDSLGGGCILRCLSNKEKWKWGTIQQFPKTTVLRCATYHNEDMMKICVVFADGTFGTWCMISRARIGFSARDTSLQLNAVNTAWVARSKGKLIAILCEDGNVAIVDEACETCNSSFLSKTIARPMCSPAFLLPAHSAYLQTALEWVGVKSSDNSESGASELEPSVILRNAVFEPPYRSPYGQLVNTTLTLQGELNLHFQLIPFDIISSIQRGVEEGDWAVVARVVAMYFGDKKKEHLWIAMNTLVNGGTKNGYNHDSMLFEACDGIKAAGLHLAKARVAAIQRHHNQDDFEARLYVSRSLIALGELQEACDLLIDSPFEYDTYAHSANLACAIAGSMNLNDALIVVTKRAAAMLLAKGDVDGAVEKFSVIGEFYEAALALQSRGRWYDAAVVAMTAPMSVSSRKELQHRWAFHEARKGNTMLAAQLLVSIDSPLEALVLLCEHAGHSSVAGTLAAMLVSTGRLCTSRYEERVSSPCKVEGDSEEEAPPIKETVQCAFQHLHTMLCAVHNTKAASKLCDISSTFGLQIREH